MVGWLRFAGVIYSLVFTSGPVKPAEVRAQPFLVVVVVYRESRRRLDRARPIKSAT